MQFQIKLSTSNIDVIEVLEILKNKKGKFIEQAIMYFLQTENGQKTIEYLKSELNYNKTKSSKPKKSKNVKNEKSSEATIDHEKFNIDTIFFDK